MLRLQQGKTGVRVVIPLGLPLKQRLDAPRAERSPDPFSRIVVNSRGKPWTGHGYSSSFRKAAVAADIDGVTFHDMRGTAVTRLSKAGATPHGIATLTGHSLRDVQQILDKHYLNRAPAMAESAIRKLETRTQSLD